jgi:hypothetical protein
MPTKVIEAVAARAEAADMGHGDPEADLSAYTNPLWEAVEELSIVAPEKLIEAARTYRTLVMREEHGSSVSGEELMDSRKPCAK